jgi:hypothetical protein
MTDDNPVEPTAEQRLAAIGIPLEEIDFGREDEPDVAGASWPRTSLMAAAPG